MILYALLFKKFRYFIGGFYMEKLVEKLAWFKKTEGIIVALVVFFPLGLYLMWRYTEFHKIVKGIITVSLCIFHLVLVAYISGYNNLVSDVNTLHTENKDLVVAYNEKEESLEELTSDYAEYKAKMKPYESLSEADAKKRISDAKAAEKVTKEIQGLPSKSDITLKEEDKVTAVKKLYDALSKEQKELVNVVELTDLEHRISELKKEAKKAEEEKKQKEKEAEEKRKKDEEEAQRKKEEEARGYDTGITYDQLARTPDDYEFKKVKFSGKVIQVMEDDDSTQIRLAVDGNYDTVLYAEYSSDAVSSRILEDDYVTISGMSMGLLTYKSTMGGSITIPSVLVKSIDQ